MSSNNGFPPMLRVTGLWKKMDKRGRNYYVGTLGALRVFAFENHEKKSQESPDIFLSIGQRVGEHGGANSGNSDNQDSTTP